MMLRWGPQISEVGLGQLYTQKRRVAGERSCCASRCKSSICCNFKSFSFFWHEYPLELCQDRRLSNEQYKLTQNTLLQAGALAYKLCTFRESVKPASPSRV